MSSTEHLFDVRPAERPSVASAFGALLLIVVAHTVLETVRDALFLRYVGPSGLGPMYVLAAGVTLAMGSFASRIGSRFGPRRALVTTQLFSAVAAGVFALLPPSRASLTGLYAFGAVAGSLLIPQLWTFVGTLFHAGQSRRVFGTIALAGVLGAVVGSAVAASALLVIEVRSLLFLSSLAFLGSAATILTAPRANRPRAARQESKASAGLSVFREEPLVPRLALVAVLGALTTLLIDYTFKSAVTQRVAPTELGSFFARYYTVMNVLALLVQLFLAQRFLAGAGVLGTAAALPSLLWLGAVLSVVTGGSFLAVLGTKVVDASLRHSVHRTGIELVYLALPDDVRNRAKPIVDGAIVRLSQAAAAGVLVLLAAIGWDAVPHIALFAAISAFAWGAATYALRRPYLALFRRTLFGAGSDRSDMELDLASVEQLVEALASPRSQDVVAAMHALDRRSGGRFIPAIVLLYDDADILACALDIFGRSTRTDWIHLAQKRIDDEREPVRRAALRALARTRAHRNDPLTSPSSEAAGAPERPWIRGYLVAFDQARDVDRQELLALIGRGGPEGDDARNGALVALGDLPVGGTGGDLLVALLETLPSAISRQTADLVARTAAHVGDPRAIPWLIQRLCRAERRAAMRTALAALGEPAHQELVARLNDQRTSRRLRAQIPQALGLFQRQETADLLFTLLHDDPDGLVRYKCLRGLGQMMARKPLRLSGDKLRSLARRELLEYFRVLSQVWALTERAARLAEGPSEPKAEKLLLALLKEKREQALERVFRVLKLAFPDENIHGLHDAILSGEPRDRATALEFLDALLAPQRRQLPETDPRPLLRLVCADLPEAEVVRRASAVGGFEAPDADTIVQALLAERDVTVASFAAAIAQSSRRPELVAASVAATEDRPSMAASLSEILRHQQGSEPAHG